MGGGTISPISTNPTSKLLNATTNCTAQVYTSASSSASATCVTVLCVIMHNRTALVTSCIPCCRYRSWGSVGFLVCPRSQMRCHTNNAPARVCKLEAHTRPHGRRHTCAVSSCLFFYRTWLAALVAYCLLHCTCISNTFVVPLNAGNANVQTCNGIRLHLKHLWCECCECNRTTDTRWPSRAPSTCSLASPTAPTPRRASSSSMPRLRNAFTSRTPSWHHVTAMAQMRTTYARAHTHTHALRVANVRVCAG